ncbi:MAG: hypothetical protein AAB224_05485 [Gemmatimonadota bacterium]
MKLQTFYRAAGVVALIAMAGCKSLDIENPNEPDAKRALSDPKALEAVAGGTMRTWFNTYDGMELSGVAGVQAQSWAASWNNFNMNFYSGLDADGTRGTRSWQNNTAAAGHSSIVWGWTGYYSVVSSANDVLKAIRTDKIVINNAADTKRAETVALMMRGAALANLALEYDKGYIVDETTDLTKLAYSNRKKMRDAALADLVAAAALAKANSFTTSAAWTNGTGYSNTQFAQIANTMAAMLLANWPRTSAENGQVAWATVAGYAAQGMSSGTPFDFIFSGDGCSAFCPEVLYWFDGFDTGRVHTRVANMLDPITQKTPWPLAEGGNGKPNSPDKRLGDGSFGDESLVDGFGSYPKTANAGTDFVWSSQANMRPDRGSYHQSNIGFIRYDLSGNQDPTGIYGGYGPVPVISRHLNDLVWAEALLRSGGSLDQAATLINKTRVTRGGLAPATAADGNARLIAKLNYEYEIEQLGLGPVEYYFRRRVGGLVPGTPNEKPVPAKELGVLGQPLYTYGGSSPLGANSTTPP